MPSPPTFATNGNITRRRPSWTNTSPSCASTASNTTSGICDVTRTPSGVLRASRDDPVVALVSLASPPVLSLRGCTPNGVRVLIGNATRMDLANGACTTSGVLRVAACDPVVAFATLTSPPASTGQPSGLFHAKQPSNLMRSSAPVLDCEATKDGGRTDIRFRERC